MKAFFVHCKHPLFGGWAVAQKIVARPRPGPQAKVRDLIDPLQGKAMTSPGVAVPPTGTGQYLVALFPNRRLPLQLQESGGVALSENPLRWRIEMQVIPLIHEAFRGDVDAQRHLA